MGRLMDSPSVKTPAKTSVLLCGDRASELAMGSFAEGVSVQIVPELCQSTRNIGQLALGATSLVVGVCSGEYSLGAIQTQARKVGLDALGVELVDLNCANGDPERLRLMVGAAVARAAAFGGSRLGNAKQTFPSRMTRRSLFRLSVPAYVSAPQPDSTRCTAGTGCHACVAVCSRGALAWTKGVITHDNAACEPCGLCVTACPTGAMVDPGITPRQLEAQIRALLDPGVGPVGARGIVYTCRRAGVSETNAGWYPVVVACTGMVPPSWLLAPLLLGAGATAARPCGDSDCPMHNDERLASTVAYCHAFLEAVGIDSGLVSMSTDVPRSGLDRRVEPDDPFGPFAADVLRALADVGQHSGDVVLDHPASPVGIIKIGVEACTGCTICAQSCPTGALAWRVDSEVGGVDDVVGGVGDVVGGGRDVVGGGREEITFDASLCTACGQCLPRCPEASRDAITLSVTTDVAALRREREVLFAENVMRCVSCGKPIAPTKMMARIRDLIGDDAEPVMRVLTRYCVDCRGAGVPPHSAE